MCCCSQSARPLLWKTLFRVIAFSVLAVSGGLIFSVVEHPNAVNNLKKKNELLDSLREDMEKKYNMTKDDFDNFTELTDEALSLDGPRWGYFEGVRFAFETLTTIGKSNREFYKKKLFNALAFYLTFRVPRLSSRPFLPLARKQMMECRLNGLIKSLSIVWG